MTDRPASRAISIMRLADDPPVGRGPVRWAIGLLQGALEAKGTKVYSLDTEEVNDSAGGTVVVADSRTARAEQMLGRAGVAIPQVPEALALVPVGSVDHPVLLACGADERGLVYAVLELADRVAHARRIRVDACDGCDETTLQYFFVLRDGRNARLYPGLDPDLSNQPYYVVCPDESTPPAARKPTDRRPGGVPA